MNQQYSASCSETQVSREGGGYLIEDQGLAQAASCGGVVADPRADERGVAGVPAVGPHLEAGHIDGHPAVLLLEILPQVRRPATSVQHCEKAKFAG